MTAQAQTHGFQTQARQLLKLMINSLYSNREVFLRELISNASDAIDRLRFRSIAEPGLVDAGEDFAITIRFDKDARTLTVEDNGIGFDQKYTDRIFGVFQRLHGRKEYEGAGIGLALCRRIAERHGGSITAKSAPGQGATVMVDLPIKQRHEENAA